MPLTRRDLLKGGLLGIAAAACRGTPKPAAAGITGSIVGGAFRRGHRLREAAPPRVAPGERTGVAIVGGGMAGLSAAWTLERAGYRDFVLLELEDAAGGTSHSGTGPVSAYPWGAHYVPVPSPANRPLVALLEEIGAVTGRGSQGAPVYAEDVLCRDPQERVFYRGEWSEGLYPRAGATRAEIAELHAFEQAMREYAGRRDAQGRRAFVLPRATGSALDESRALDRGSMAAFLKDRGFSSPRLRWFVEYGCRDDFGATLEQTSAWAGVHYFASRVDADTGEGADFLTWPEGNGRLVRHLAGVAAPRVRVGCVVRRVEEVPGQGVTVSWHDEASGEQRALHAEHVVFALPRFLVGPVLGTPGGGAAPVYGSWMVANLTLRERPLGRGFPLAWDNVLFDSPSLGYVVATHQRGREQGPTVLTYYLPMLEDDVRAGRRRLMDTPWSTWVEAILTDLSRAHPGLAERVANVDVWLWGHAMVRPGPGTLWSEELQAARRPRGRVHFAHTDLSGMALFEEAQYWGVHAAETVLAAQGHRYTSWL
jgi:glycine/D-amino acid oxidase-like deaminating enzyme